MINKIKNTVEISYGNYWMCLDGKQFAIGNDAVDKYLQFERAAAFIGNERVKLYVVIRMIKGDTLDDALNKVIDKVHIIDPDYRNTLCY